MYSERGRYVINIYISREISIEHPSVGLASLAQLSKTKFGRKYVKTSMSMLTILRVRECNYEKLALRTSKQQSAYTSNNFNFASPLMGTIF